MSSSYEDAKPNAAQRYTTNRNGTNPTASCILAMERPNVQVRAMKHDLIKDSSEVIKNIGVIRYLQKEFYQNGCVNLFGIDLTSCIKTKYPFVYRINDGTSSNIILQSVCQQRGWVQYKEPMLGPIDRHIHDAEEWNLWWSYNFYQGRPFRPLKCWQFTNHNAKAFQFCSKSYLSSFLRRMKAEYGDVFDIIPRTYVLPNEYVRFVTEHTRRQQEDCTDAHNVITTIPPSPGPTGDASRNHATHFLQVPSQRTGILRTPVWITKPIGKSQGKGIYLSTDISLISTAHRVVVQEYITRPFLIGGYKWDIRIYVCITSVEPLTIYLYREGLCRFATEKFDMNKLTSSFSHLTNASLNKLAPEYTTDKEVIGSGCKWSLKQLRKYFRDIGVSDWLLWQRIMIMVVATVVSEGLTTGFSWPINKNCFDFFGFDILVDENLRPWLLEVNYSPGLGGDCEVDEVVKKPMLHELFDLLGYPDCSKDMDSKAKFHSTLCMKNSLRPPQKATEPPLIFRTNNNNKKSESVDYSSQARLKDAQAIYSQGITSSYLKNFSRDPSLKLTHALQVLMKRRKAQERKEQDKKLLLSRISPNNEGPDHITADSSSSDELNCSIPLNEPTTEVIPEGPQEQSIQNVRSTGSYQYSYDKEKDEVSNEESAESGTRCLFLKRPDWIFPKRSSGNWVLVHPNQAFTYRCSRRSPLSELRALVSCMDQHIRTAAMVFSENPDKSDDFYKNRLKELSVRWDTDLWTPPLDR